MKKYIQDLLARRKQKKQPVKQEAKTEKPVEKKETPKAEQLNDNLQAKIKDAADNIHRAVYHDKDPYDTRIVSEVLKAKQRDKGKDKGPSL